MHDQDHAFSPEADAGNLHGEDDASAHRERRCRFQITAAQAEIGELARRRRIVLLKIGAVAFQPRVKPLEHGGRQIQKRKSNLAAGIFPGHVGITFDVVLGPEATKIVPRRFRFFGGGGPIEWPCRLRRYRWLRRATVRRRH